MSSSEKFLVVLAILGGVGGLLNTLLYSDIVAALNARRPPDDAIPFTIMSWDEFKKKGRWHYWQVLMQFHREFPDSKLYYWSIVCAAWMFLLFVIAIGVLSNLK
jgi:hypothetical protein